MFRDLWQLARVVVGGVLVRAGRTIAGPEPGREEPEPVGAPMGHPVVQLSEESRRMIAEGQPTPPVRRVERPAPLRGSVAARFGVRS